MHRRNEQGVRLLKEAKGSITRIISSFPADPPLGAHFVHLERAQCDTCQAVPELRVEKAQHTPSEPPKSEIDGSNSAEREGQWNT
eukprot:5674337-Amphidinium_carterae.1